MGPEIWKETMCSALNGRKEEETEWRRRMGNGGEGGGDDTRYVLRGGPSSVGREGGDKGLAKNKVTSRSSI